MRAETTPKALSGFMVDRSRFSTRPQKTGQRMDGWREEDRERERERGRSAKMKWRLSDVAAAWNPDKYKSLLIG